MIHLALAIVLVVLAMPIQAQPRGPMQRPGPGTTQDTLPDMQSGTVRPGGLRPAFPHDARCPDIASPFGSPTRYDGSPRVQWSNDGRHGGIDITLPEGTPLLAIAAGTVVATGEGGILEGIYLWLRHPPEDTGLLHFVYSKYQHLQALPDIAVGARVAVGDVIARSGKTGTTGGHYGSFGYPHLHLGIITSARGDEPVGSRASGRRWTLVDALTLYRDAGAHTEGGAVTIPYAIAGGGRSPASTRLVWPVTCAPR